LHRIIVAFVQKKKKKKNPVEWQIAGALVAACHASWWLPCAQLDWDALCANA